MKQLITQIIGCIVIVYFSTLPSIVLGQNDSALLVRLNNRKLTFTKQLNVIQDSIKKIDNQIIRIESNMRLSSYKSDNAVKAYLNTSNKIRKQPEPLSPIIGSASLVELLDYNSNDYWLVRSDSLVGFVSSLYVIYNDEIQQLQDAFIKRNKIREEEQYRRKVADAVEKEKIKDAQYKASQEKRRKSLIAKYGEKVGTQIYEGYYWIGMTKEMAKESLGSPNDINKSVGAWGVHEQWVYGDSYLYFENGILTSYQN